MKASKFMFFVFVVFSCKSNIHLQKDITKENFSIILECNKLEENDSIWLNRKTICIKEKGSSIKVGNPIKNKKKWYHYYVTKDTIDCYLIEKVHKKDTVAVYSSYQNPRYW